MRPLAPGSVLLVFVLSTTSALAEPQRGMDEAGRGSEPVPLVVRPSVPVGLRAELVHAPPPTSSPEGFARSMRARLASAPAFVIRDPAWFPTLAASRGRGSEARVFVNLAPRAALDRVGIGRTVRLSHGRALVMDLTPSPAHCAPLVSLTF